MRVLSVDLGTSNTVAVLSAHGRPPRVVDVDGASMMPSAVFATEDGTLVAGREAERRARLDPSRFEPNPKRRVDEGTLLLGDKVVPVTDALAAVLRKVAEETSRQLGGAVPDEVRLTHPAQWGPVRRNVLLSAARQAGLGSSLVLVPEPVAAAAHFALFTAQALASGQALAVYDLGAGTFDVAVVAATQNGFVVLAEAGLPDLGGLDVDQALLQHVGQQVAHRDPEGWQRLLMPVSTVDRRSARALREDVRAAKEALSSHPQTDLPLPEPFEDVLVTRVELEALIRPNLVRSAELLAATIRTTGLSPDRLAGIYLVGGSSRIPLIATLIAEQLRVVPASLDQPETAVALGAQHVSAEGVGLRTEDLASTLSQARSTTPPAEERTVAIASPPRPAPVAARPPHPATQSGCPAAAPRHGASTSVCPSTPTRRAEAQASDTMAHRTTSQARWCDSDTVFIDSLASSLTGAGVVLVAAVAVIVVLLANQRQPEGGGVEIAHPKKLAGRGIDCATVPVDEVKQPFDGTSGTVENLGAACLVKITTPGYEVTARVEFDYLDPEAGASQTELEGNVAYEQRQGVDYNLDCAVKVAIAPPDSGKGTPTTWLLVSAKGGGDPCLAARSLAQVVFGNLPDA